MIEFLHKRYLSGADPPKHRGRFGPFNTGRDEQ
jgi:hypothetical protein